MVKNFIFCVCLLIHLPLMADKDDILDELDRVSSDLEHLIEKKIVLIKKYLRHQCNTKLNINLERPCETRPKAIFLDQEEFKNEICNRKSQKIKLMLDDVQESCQVIGLINKEATGISHENNVNDCVNNPFKKMINDQDFLLKIVSKMKDQKTNSLPSGSKGAYLVKKDEDVTPLFNFDSYLEKLKAMHNAKESILSEDLEFFGDVSGILMGELLIWKRQKGIDVKQIIDGFAMDQGLKENELLRKNTLLLYNNMMAAGIPVYGYSGNGDLTKNAFELNNPLSFLKRRHEKFVITDAQEPDVSNIGTTKLIMGGQNKGDGYNGIARFSYTDVDVMVTAKDKKYSTIHDAKDAYAKNLAREQMRYANSEKGGGDSRVDLNPYDPIEEKKQYEDFFKKNYKPYVGINLVAVKGDDFFDKENGENGENRWRNVLPDYDKALEGNPSNYVSNPHVEELLNRLSSLEQGSGKEPIHTEQTRLIHNRPKHKEHQILDAYVDLIDGEPPGGKIIIENAYFLPSRFVLKAIYNALKRGVKVTIITNHPSVNHDLKLLTLIGRLNYEKLISSGAQIYEVTGKPKDTKTSDYSLESPRDTLHAKVALFESQNVSIVSSYNLDYVSERVNSESAILIKSSEFMMSLANQMANTIDRFSNEIDAKKAEDFKKIYRNFKGIIASPVSRYL